MLKRKLILKLLDIQIINSLKDESNKMERSIAALWPQEVYVGKRDETSRTKR